MHDFVPPGLHRSETMQKNDHRVLGKRLDLFHFQDEAPGMAFWHPRGFALLRCLEEAVRELLAADGYQEVRTPQLLRRSIWEASGHWQHFYAGMFRVEEDPLEAALKPVSCPGHIGIAAQRAPSYRQLPLRFAELGVVHRDEPSGTLHGLMRLRQFTQDDGHVFCRPDQVRAEVDRFVAGMVGFYRAFGFEHIALGLSLRPDERVGSDEQWDQAEAVLRDVLVQRGMAFQEQPGQGAFYGPKIEVALRDREGRGWQCGTIQVDFAMPERFGLDYVDAEGLRRPVAMLHRAMYGSLERFLGILLEHYGARLPAWLAPVQVRVIPVSEHHAASAAELARALGAARLRAELDDRNESVSRRIVQAEHDAAAHVLVLGDRELEQDSVAWRRHSGNEAVARTSIVDDLAKACRAPHFAATAADAR
ncbi:MAG: threonine--tRNA ligase [Polyangiaceae bacterium]